MSPLPCLCFLSVCLSVCLVFWCPGCRSELRFLYCDDVRLCCEQEMFKFFHGAPYAVCVQLKNLLSIQPSIYFCLSIQPFIYFYIPPSNHPSFVSYFCFPSNHPSICFIHPSNHFYIHPTIFLFFPVHPSNHLSIFAIHPAIYFSIPPTILFFLPVHSTIHLSFQTFFYIHPTINFIIFLVSLSSHSSKKIFLYPSNHPYIIS